MKKYFSNLAMFSMLSKGIIEDGQCVMCKGEDYEIDLCVIKEDEGFCTFGESSDFLLNPNAKFYVELEEIDIFETLELLHDGCIVGCFDPDNDDVILVKIYNGGIFKIGDDGNYYGTYIPKKIICGESKFYKLKY